MSSDPYPLIVEPILKEKVWGGRRLEHFGKQLPEDVQIGESWELADLSSTSLSGGGGGEARSRIRNGPSAGETLHAVLQQWGRRFLGNVPVGETGDFPLLVKYLDAREHLSVQVHPTAEYVADHPEAFLKTESWFVLEAEPGAAIYKGVQHGTTRRQFAAAAARGGSLLVDLLERVPVTAGDFHHLPSGTVHALGAGVLVAEIQTPSDTTYRLYDWAEEFGRLGRPLHIDEALANARLEPPEAATRLPATAHRSILADTEHYTVEALHLGSDRIEGLTPGMCHVLLVVAGSGTLRWSDEALVLDRGTTCVVPAAVAEASWLAAPQEATFLATRLGGDTDHDTV